MTVDFKIVAVKERQKMAESLRDALELADADIVYDERPGGGNPYVPTKEAWLKPCSAGVTHRVVLNEDVQVCQDFKQVCNQIAHSHPDCAFSLFTRELDSIYYDDFITSLSTPFVEHNWALWGCAILLPLSIVEECFQYIDACFDENVHESYGILSFLKHRKIPIIAPMPVIAQHIGDDSLYDPALPVRRTCRFEEDPKVDWANPVVAKAPQIEWFIPKNRTVNTQEKDTFLEILKGVETNG